MVFLTSRNASGHILLSLVSSYSQRCPEVEIHQGYDLVSQATPFSVACETSSHPYSLVAHLPYRHTNVVEAKATC